MLSTLALNGVTLHETSHREVVSVAGLVGISPVRRSARERPTADGSIDDSRYRDESLVTIAGETFGTYDEAFSEFRILSTQFLSTLTSPGLLTWTEGVTGLALQRVVKLASAVEPTLTEGPAILRYGAVLASSDPSAYSQTLTTAVGNTLSTLGGGMVMPFVFPFTFAVSGGGLATFVNSGNTITRPLLRIYGDCTNPIIVVGLSRITLVGPVAAGEYVEIDLSARTITRVSTAGISTSAMSMLDAANTQWFSLAPGSTTLQMLASTFDAIAHLEVVGRSAYA